jgi:serine phosphatase RsbU (regulator of sigma subunit)
MADLVWFLAELTAFHFFGLPDIFQYWGVTLLEVRAFTTTGVIAALLALLFRDQRQAAEESAMLAGEMASAREIQQYLIPEKLPPTPGLEIASVYMPSREVGGDFFQVLPDARDGSTLIVVGDVAGKGLKAGMLAALIVGAIRTAFKFTADPGRILALLNERLQGRGLVTCLAMRINRNGSVDLANAGHLPPYLNGRELATEGALPLGALPEAFFPGMQFQLNAGEPLLLVSDGVIEARNKNGELFGFDRTRQVSTQSADSIAQAAQAFGQDDDITVLRQLFKGAKEFSPRWIPRKSVPGQPSPVGTVDNPALTTTLRARSSNTAKA